MAGGFFKITSFTADTLVRISGFVFNMTNHTPSVAICVTSMGGGATGGNIRIDHNEFDFGYQNIEFNHLKGLIDNNVFKNGYLPIYLGSGSRDNSESAWSDLTAGTADAQFIEDNTFITDENYPGAGTQEQIGNISGSKIVIRYNTFDGDNIPGSLLFDPIHLHGSADGGCGGQGYWQQDDATARCKRRGPSVVEIYKNTAHAKNLVNFIQLRGSTTLIYDNEITGVSSSNPRIFLWEEEYSSDIGWTIPRTAWPAEDQVHNTFIWNNTYRGHDFNDSTYGYVTSSPIADAGLLKDRDYFLHEPQAAGGQSKYTGKNGSTNTYPTDGETYATTGSMSFKADTANKHYGFIPYTYPHPLRGQNKIKVTATIGVP
jgi:hypothetical protein